MNEKKESSVHGFIPYAKHWIDEKDIDEVVKIMKDGWITQGPKIKEFENRIASFVNAKHAVAFSSGTAALHAASFAAGISRGEEAITTSMTFAASSNCILYQNGRPVFADIDKRTYNIDSNEIKKKITDKTKAIIPVDFTGQPCDLDPIFELAEKNNLTIIEDACHALGSTYKGNKIGSISDLNVFSFHPAKHITTAEGGIVCTNSKELYDRLLLFRNHGITKDFDKLQSSNVGSWFYEQQVLGYNYRINDLQCALGLSQLKRIKSFINRRKEIVNRYNEEFEKVEELVTPFQLEFVDSSWHLYVIQLNLERIKVNRRIIFDELRNNNLGVQVHYIPVYLHPYYQKLGYKNGLCPNSEWLYERIISLPLYPKMTDSEVGFVVDTVRRIVKKYSK
jgi:UDP-4-amino-4,6-dideoxy-N-acetyl-beta-L-altrosamine transaminase